MLGKIVVGDSKVKEFFDPNTLNLVQEVSTKVSSN